MKNLLIQGAILPIRAYRLFLSPLVGHHCRFQPTCSAYAVSAIEEFGLIPGVALAFRRLLRCHPWGSSGFDPVTPDTKHSHS